MLEKLFWNVYFKTKDSYILCLPLAISQPKKEEDKPCDVKMKISPVKILGWGGFIIFMTYFSNDLLNFWELVKNTASPPSHLLSKCDWVKKQLIVDLSVLAIGDNFSTWRILPSHKKVVIINFYKFINLYVIVETELRAVKHYFTSVFLLYFVDRIKKCEKKNIKTFQSTWCLTR